MERVKERMVKKGKDIKNLKIDLNRNFRVRFIANAGPYVGVLIQENTLSKSSAIHLSNNNTGYFKSTDVYGIASLYLTCSSIGYTGSSQSNAITVTLNPNPGWDAPYVYATQSKRLEGEIIVKSNYSSAFDVMPSNSVDTWIQ